MGIRIALFGQAAFGRDCLDHLREDGHEIVGVCTPLEEGRPDPLAARARELDIDLIQRRYFRRKSGEPIPAALAAYGNLDAELNVLAFVNAFLPRQIVDAPKHRSLCFHPSLLPRYRGGNALAWQIIEGERESGVSIFVPDEGVDTGPIVVQKGGVRIGPDDTTGSLYIEKLYPLGLESIREAVNLVASGRADPLPQDDSRATSQGLVDDTVARIDLSRPAAEIDQLIRGCDPQPGAFVRIHDQRVRLYDTSLEGETDARPGTVLSVDEDGLRFALLGGSIRVGRVRADSKKEAAQEFARRVALRPGDRI